MSMTIFLSIVSYRDELLHDTLISALDTADQADELAFAVVDQSDRPADWSTDPGLRKCCRYLHVPHREARGPCWARSIAAGLWQGEAYFLQIDAHTVFDIGWDTVLIEQLESMLTETPRAVLSTYPPGFTLNDGLPSRSEPARTVIRLDVMPDSDLRPQSATLRFHGIRTESTKSLEGFHVGAGCLFTRGFFIQEIPPDPFLYFEGEEQNIAIRAWTAGWRIFHPPVMPVYHLYNKDNARPLHWDASAERGRVVDWRALQDRSSLRLRRLLFDGENLGAYGLGSVKSLQEYAEFSGIDYLRKKVRRREITA
jgi:hypothetical protein